MHARRLSEYYNCDRVAESSLLYEGKHLGFYAVADHIDDGYAFARDIPLPQARGLDVFEGKSLPERVVFVYPEHTLVPRQQQQFVHQLITHYPIVHSVIIITTSAVILTDALTCEVLHRPPPSQP